MRAIAVLLLLSLVGCAVAERGNGAPSAADEQDLRRLEDQERIAVLNGDVATLQRLWSEGFTVNTPMNRISPDRAAVLDLVRRGVLRYASFDRRIEQLRVQGDLAIVMGGETVQPAASPPVAPVQRRFTHVWRRDAQGWRLVARHANDVATR